MGERRVRGRGGAGDGASSAWAPVLGLVGLSAASLAAFTAIGVASLGPEARTAADLSAATSAPGTSGVATHRTPAVGVGDSEATALLGSAADASITALPPTAARRLDAVGWVQHGTPSVGTPLLAVGGTAVGVGEIAAAPLFLPGSLGQLTQADVLAAGSRSVTEGSALAALQGTFLLGPQLAGVQVLASDAGVRAATTVRADGPGSTSATAATAVMAALAPVASTLVAAGASPDTPLVAIAALAPSATDKTLSRQAVIAAAAVPSATPTGTLAAVAAMARSAVEPADGTSVARTQTAAPSRSTSAAGSTTAGTAGAGSGSGTGSGTGTSTGAGTGSTGSTALTTTSGGTAAGVTTGSTGPTGSTSGSQGTATTSGGTGSPATSHPTATPTGSGSAPTTTAPTTTTAPSATTSTHATPVPTDRTPTATATPTTAGVQVAPAPAPTQPSGGAQGVSGDAPTPLR